MVEEESEQGPGPRRDDRVVLCKCGPAVCSASIHRLLYFNWRRYYATNGSLQV